MVNHYGQNGAFTTKVGLCTNLKSAHWFEDISHETFYPRCYRLSHEEEKGTFTGVWGIYTRGLCLISPLLFHIPESYLSGRKYCIFHFSEL